MRSLVSFQINLEKKRADAYNVIGILPGTDRTLKNEAIIIGAHYDHLGHGGQGSLDVNSTAIHHGADDNASGTAAILELAREFVREKKNKRTLIFIAFGGEEEGLIGSKYYVNNPVFPLDKTIAMINLDMVGRLKDQKLTVGGIGTASEWNQTVNGVLAEWMREQLNAGIRKYTADVEAVKQNNNLKASATRGNDAKNRIGVDAGLQTDSLNLQLNQDGFGPSDHSSFYGKKIPVLFFTGTHEDYHKPSDTADKINYDGLENVVSYVADLVRSIDQHQQRPTYTVAKSSGIGGGRSGFNISLGTVPSYVDSTDGLVLDGVRDNSPAAKAGLKPGDKVVKLAGKDVRNVMDYTYILGEMKAGEEYEIVVIRGGERVAMTIIPVKR
jgi:Zn-dependent M28 family amino/carboxypeptidase